MQRGCAHRHGILTAYIFSEDLAGEGNYYSQDAARSRSVKGKCQGHRGQRSRSLCNFIGQKGTISTIIDLFVSNYCKMGQIVRENIILLTKLKNTSQKCLFYKWQAVSFVTMPVNWYTVAVTL